MNVLCNCGGRTPCIQRFCDSIPLVQARTDDVLAVADCIEEVRQAEPAELAELTAQWKMLVRAKFRKAVAALNEPGKHSECAVEPVEQAEPAGHGAHELAFCRPSVLEYEPAGHGSSAAAPELQ